MMLSNIFICFLLVKFGCGQVDGEFWWLNDKFANYVGAQPPAPKFEDISELDNDENARIIFRDDHNTFTNNVAESTNTKQPHEKATKEEVSEISVVNLSGHDNILYNKSDTHNQNLTDYQIDSSLNGDRFVFKFPKDDTIFTWPDIKTTAAPVTEKNIVNNNTNSTALYNDKVSFAIHYEEKLSENICTYMKKSECFQSKGVINIDLKERKKITINGQLICCVIPLKNKNEDVSLKIHFPDTPKIAKRPRRSNNADKQRRILLQNKHKKHRNVDDYEYDDPYVNIKNHKRIHTQESNIRYDYVENDYVDNDYVAEVPEPGLTGIYSDTYQDKYGAYDGVDEFNDDDDTDFGYSTIDPRVGNNKKRKSNSHIPSKLSTKLDETSEEKSQTISYHSHPDFNVLPGFKLPNLMRDKPPRRSRTTTESNSEEPIRNGYSDASSEIDLEDKQVFKDCGKTARSFNMKDKGKQIGDTVNGSHPWLAVLVPTNKKNIIMCYATIIHSRAAVSAGHCGNRTTAGSITLLAGLWNLEDRSQAKSRIATPLFHPNYKSGDLKNNLVILHWKRPLRLGVNVQPICVAKPQFNYECMFVGWGGFDQALRPQSRWQRTSVHHCKDIPSLVGSRITEGAFCASVKARSTVTGVGGSLVCKINGVLSAVGVAVSKESTLILLPIYDWVTSHRTASFFARLQTSQE